MGHMFDESSKCFNGAALGRARRYVAARTYERMIASLQRGRARESAEITEWQKVTLTLPAASTGPRSGERGDLSNNPSKPISPTKLQRGRARESAEIGRSSG